MARIAPASLGKPGVKQQPLPPHWYKRILIVCPECGGTKVTRRRMMGKKPTDWLEREERIEQLDWCGF